MSERIGRVLGEAVKGLIYPAVLVAGIILAFSFPAGENSIQCEKLHPKKGSLYDQCVAKR